MTTSIDERKQPSKQASSSNGYHPNGTKATAVDHFPYGWRTVAEAGQQIFGLNWISRSATYF